MCCLWSSNSSRTIPQLRRKIRIFNRQPLGLQRVRSRLPLQSNLQLHRTASLNPPFAVGHNTEFRTIQIRQHTLPKDSTIDQQPEANRTVIRMYQQLCIRSLIGRQKESQTAGSIQWPFQTHSGIPHTLRPLCTRRNRNRRVHARLLRQQGT